jgi:hypothetical protein
MPHNLCRQWYDFITSRHGLGLSQAQLADIIASDPGLFADGVAQLPPADQARVRTAMVEDGIAERFSHLGGHEVQ